MLGVVGVACYENISEWSAEDKYIFDNLVEEIRRNKLRFKDTKFFEFFYFPRNNSLRREIREWYYSPLSHSRVSRKL